jgi:hypothetical protein
MAVVALDSLGMAETAPNTPKMLQLPPGGAAHEIQGGAGLTGPLPPVHFRRRLDQPPHIRRRRVADVADAKGVQGRGLCR